MLADNRLAELSEWDEEVLALELEELALVDELFELTDTGFELAKIDVLIEERHRPDPETDPADGPVALAAVQAAARPGDLWRLGKHRLFVGNALEQDSYQVLLEGERAQMVFIDPPYNVPIRGMCLV